MLDPCGTTVNLVLLVHCLEPPMLATLVTFERPKWAAAIARHLIEEPGVGRVAILDNSCDAAMLGELKRRLGRFGYELDCQDHGKNPGPLLAALPAVCVVSKKNLGAGMGRNRLLRWRKRGEPYIRIDDDWVPKQHGWCSAALELIEKRKYGVVRLEPSARKGSIKPRHLDAHGPIWIVGGECADALGFFYTGFGRTLLDDLEYARRVVEWGARRQGKIPGLVDLGWPVRDFCSETNTPGRPWLAPKALFLERARQIMRRKFPLYVPLKQPPPGWEQRNAGIDDSETHSGKGVRWT